MKVKIEDFNDDGRGRGTLGKRTVLVSQAHPGEEVTVRLDRKTLNTLQGRVKRLVEADPRRISHDCRHEFKCTGCPMLAVPMEEEEAFKARRVELALEVALRRARKWGWGPAPEALDLPDDFLTRALQPVRTPTGPFHYRCFGKQVVALKQRRIVFGSYVGGTHDVVDNNRCPVLVPELARLFDTVRLKAEEMRLSVDSSQGGDSGRPGLRYVVARHSLATGRQLLLLITRAPRGVQELALARRLVAEVEPLAGAHVLVNQDTGNALLKGKLLWGAGDKYIEEELGGEMHRLAPRTFFQINPAAAQVLAEETLAAAGEGKLCLEAFSGVGALTLPLARRFQKVVAVEFFRESVELLNASAQAAGLSSRIAVQKAKVQEILPPMLAAKTPDCVVLDPPRKGMGPIISKALAESKVRRVVLLSCDPVTLGRDLPPLLASGFQLEKVVPVNQFPRTAHVETVSLLTR